MKNKYWLKGVLLLTFLGLFSCSSSENGTLEKRLFIASKKGDCIGFVPQKCFLIKENSQDEWKYFYDNIDGFTFEEGFEYELLVSEKSISPVEDGSSIKTTLIKIISKIDKDSENLPTFCTGLSNPLENLAWLKEKKTDFETSTTASKKKIIQYKYKNNVVFKINECVDCPDNLVTVYNCKKEVICEFGGISGLNTCPDFEKNATNKIILWEN